MNLKKLDLILIGIVNRLMNMHQLVNAVQAVYAKMVLLHGQEQALGQTKAWLARLLKLAALIISVTLLALMLTGGELLVAFLGLLCICFVPIAAYRDLHQQLVARRRRIQLELPKVINQFLLFVNAGESVQSALIRCAEKGEPDHPLSKELNYITLQLKNNQSFQKTLEQFNRNCGVQEVSFFVNTLLMNYRRGGEQLSASLRMLSNQLWHEQKTIVKTMGEEASAKLVFPMILIFLAILVIIGAPAVLLMNF